MRTTQSPGRSASFGGPGFLDGELGGGVRFEALVRNRLAAADGPAIGAVVQPVQGAPDGVKPVAQALGDRVTLHLVALGNEQAARAVLVHKAVLPQSLRAAACSIARPSTRPGSTSTLAKYFASHGTPRENA